VHQLSLCTSQDAVLRIENVGNLVCPAGFHVSEDAKAMVNALTFSRP
jgi:Ni2+-binding GTPase involved in maturation of urease and hydrogenase